MLFYRIFIVPEPNVSQNTWCFGDLNDVSLGKNLAPNSNLFDMAVEFGVDIATSFITVYPPQPPQPHVNSETHVESENHVESVRHVNSVNIVSSL